MDATATQQKPGRYMPAARKHQLLVELAIGETSMQLLADKYGITYQHVRRIASAEKAEIEALKTEIAERERQLIWATDRFSRNLERVTDLVRIEEQLAKLEELAGSGPASEQWLKLIKMKQRILREIAEDYGQVPRRPTGHQLGLLPDLSPTPADRIPEPTPAELPREKYASTDQWRRATGNYGRV